MYRANLVILNSMKKDRFQKTFIEGVAYIQIGHYGYGEYGLYVKEGGDEVCVDSVFHQPSIYTLNKNFRTFFLVSFN
ncbi:hypothetical protein HMSSN036_40500 [Paenibacillus macerans]|nr:hypothetical protein HMSSN036_40500 [Paenibacillus macerans]